MNNETNSQQQENQQVETQDAQQLETQTGPAQTELLQPEIMRRGIISARVLVDNSGNTARRFHIQGEAMVSGSGAGSIESGYVMPIKDGVVSDVPIAKFNSYGSNGLNTNFEDSADIDPVDLTVEITRFVVKTKESFSDGRLV